MLDTLSFAQIAWIVAAILTAYIIRGMSGFGAGLVASPLLAFVLPVHVVVPLGGLLVFILFIFLTIRDRRDVIWPELKRLAPPTVGGVVAGLLLFRSLDNHLLTLMLGGFLIVYSTYMFAVQAFQLPQFRFSEKWAWPLGLPGSFFDTLFGGGGGTLVVIYMHGRGIGRAEFRATLATLWLIEMLTRIAGYGLGGYYTRDVLILVAALVPVMLAGSWAGERLGNRVSPATFSRILAALLMASGISLVLK